MANWLVWKDRHGNFDFGPRGHSSICRAIDAMGCGDQGMQSIFGIYGHSFSLGIELMIPSNVFCNKFLRGIGLSKEFENGSLVNENTAVGLRAIVEGLIAGARTSTKGGGE